jgi:hypothetical protein
MSASEDSDTIPHEEESEMEYPFEDGENLHDVLETFFTEPKKNRNIVDVLLEIKRSLEVHNKIMIKLLTHFTQSATTVDSSEM